MGWLKNITGLKTYIAGGAMVLYGISGMAMHFIDPDNAPSLDISVKTLLEGLAIIGIGHKIDRVNTQ